MNCFEIKLHTSYFKLCMWSLWMEVWSVTHLLTGWCMEKLTWANDSSILMMTTVMSSPSFWSTILQCCLWSPTVHIIHPDWSWSSSKVSPIHCIYSLSTSHLSTHHCSIINTPVLITHCSPLTIMMNLHSTSTETVTTNQPHSFKICTWKRKKGI